MRPCSVYAAQLRGRLPTFPTLHRPSTPLSTEHNVTKRNYKSCFLAAYLRFLRVDDTMRLICYPQVGVGPVGFIHILIGRERFK